MTVNLNARDPNIQLLLLTVERLAGLLDELVFLGGCTTGLLITDPGAPPVRATKDVDAIVEIASYSQYVALSERLQRCGFAACVEESAPICRWVAGDLRLDVMPTEKGVLGFDNKWYRPALHASERVEINHHRIRVVTAPYFMATKLEAFHGRGKGDFLSSPDIEDMIAVIDGRAEITSEVRESEADLREYLRREFATFLRDPSFVEAISAHLYPDAASQARFELVLERLRAFL